MTELIAGAVFEDRFELIEQLGAGGMGEVWLAMDREREDQVALKFLRADLTNRPGMAQLLRRELRNTRALRHPFIVRAHEMHSTPDGQHFLSMAAVRGPTMATLIGKPGPDYIPALMGVADALAHAHQRGVIHRDLKLSNILLDADGRPHVCDFGIAGLVNEGKNAVHLGTPGSAYGASPQQLEGEAPQPADDIYAFGSMLYELMAGQPPFFPKPVRDRILNESPEPLDPGLPAPLREIAMQALAKRPEDRPQDMQTLKRELAGALRAIGGDTPPPELTEGADPALEFGSIAPVELQVSQQSLRGRDGRRQIPASLAAVVLLIMATALVLTVVFLPGFVEDRRADAAAQKAAAPVASAEPTATPGQASTTATQTQQQSPPPAETGLSPYELRVQRQQRERAETILDEFVNFQMQLEEKNIEAWAEEDLKAAKRQAIAGDDLFRKQEFIAAGEAYAEGVTMLKALAQRAVDDVKDGLASGQAALDEGNQPLAQRAFSQVLVIEPENEAAASGLVRAEKLDDVLALMQEGRDAEANGDLVGAREAYANVKTLDPLWRPAAESLERVRSRISQGRFATSMSQGFAALERRDTDAARAAFEQAAKQRPGSSDPKEGMAQVDLMQRDMRIAELRESADNYEQQQEWGQALAAFKDVLALDDTLIFAKQGRDRVKDRAAVAVQLKTLLDQPERLSSQRVLQSARSLIADGRSMPGAGARIATQLDSLTQLVRLYDTPVDVNLLSDNICEVVVYRVGRLGSFENKQLALRPGQYTAVGTRAGFRDVRREFTVPAGGPPATVELRCEEPI